MVVQVEEEKEDKFSCVSLKSDHSMGDPPNFCNDPGSPETQ